MRPPIVSIDGVTKRFGETAAVDQVSIDIQANEFFALLGPSGCGKTTLLRMLAGFETPNEGRILIDGDDMTRVPPNRRPVNMVFQSYAVFPHMTVEANVAYGLKVEGIGGAELRRRVDEALAMVRLENFRARKPDQLSGGQRQRVALARALIKRPKVLLLDEPLSALDKKLREQMQLELVRLQHEVGITFVMVTHDQEEALSMANRIAVMDHGRVLQIADPRTLYEHPTHRFVAEFIGTVNSLDVEVRSVDGPHARIRHPLLGEITVERAAPDVERGVVVARPEKLRLDFSAPPVDGEILLDAVVEQIAYYGDLSFVFVRCPDGTALQISRYNVNRQDKGDPAAGSLCRVGIHPDDLLLVGTG
ncbi:MAG: ABC transporter ATP-binding protein [Geminicoccaceae bacterium]|nr:MAG: ABC transporter ATP-binding protein [Geminicoccaceae bacterium]